MVLWQPIIWNTVEMHISLSICSVWGGLPSALPTTHILNVFLVRPIAKLKSQLSACQMDPALSTNAAFFFQGTLWNGFCFQTAIQWHPRPGPAKSPPPRPEPLRVYTNSSEKYGCVIMEVVSLMSHLLLWKHCMLGQLLRGGWWNSERPWHEDLVPLGL